MASPDEDRENGKERKETSEIILTRWSDRFLAWLIDFIIVSIALAVLFSAITLPICIKKQREWRRLNTQDYYAQPDQIPVRSLEVIKK